MPLGDVYAFQVAKGREVLFRVVATHGEHHCALVTRWEGAAPATLSRVRRDARLFELQPHDHHRWSRPFIGTWVSAPPPPELRWVGNVPVKPKEAARVVHPQVYVAAPAAQRAALTQKVVPVGGWELVQARLQWRWEHEREALLAEEAAQERARAASFGRALAEQAKAREALARRGVKALARRRFFSVWRGERPKALVTAAEALMREAVGELDGLTPARATRRLVKLVRDFNRLDGRFHAFDTADAEDIMDAVGTLATACGVGAETFDDVVDAARDF